MAVISPGDPAGGRNKPRKRAGRVHERSVAMHALSARIRRASSAATFYCCLSLSFDFFPVMSTAADVANSLNKFITTLPIVAEDDEGFLGHFQNTDPDDDGNFYACKIILKLKQQY